MASASDQTPFKKRFPQTDGHTKFRRLAKIVRHTEHGVFWVAIGISLLYFLLQMPLVQNQLVRAAAHYLSNELDNTVSVRHVDIQFFDNLLIEGVFVSDQSGDTLVYIERLSAGLNANVFTLLKNKLEFNELALYGARFYLHRAEADFDYNIKFLIDFFSGGKKSTKEPAPFSLRIQNLRLRDIAFEKNDQLRGQRLFVYLNNAAIRLDRMQVPQQVLSFQKVLIDGFRMDLQEFPVPGPGGEQRPTAQPVSQPAPVDSIARTVSQDTFWINIDRFALSNGQFGMDRFDLSPGRTMPDSVMDFEHLFVDNIAIKADSVRFNDQLQFEGLLNHLAARESCGFEVKHAQAKRVVVNDTLTGLYGLQLETGGSRIGDTVLLNYAQYEDYNQFVDNVMLDLRLKPESVLLLRDLTHFSAALARNPFFRTNTSRPAMVSGYMYGSVNRLNGRDVRIALGESTQFEGDFDLDDMAEGPDRLRMQFDCRNLQASIKTLRNILPGFSAPQQFDELGSFSFTGLYQLLFGYNHILSGNLTSEVGYGTLDMKLDLTDGRDKATYSGELNMRDFNLAAWTGNQDFGKSAFRVTIAEGSSGLRLASLQTDIDGHIDSLFFRGYPYHDIDMDAQLNGYNFSGKVDINDPFLDLTVNGRADLSDSIKVFDFTGAVRRAELQELKLLDKDWVFSGLIPHLRLTGSSVDNISGDALLRNLYLFQDSTYTHHLDSIVFQSRYIPENQSHRYALLSDAVDGYLNGQFTLSTLATNVGTMFADYFPGISRNLGIVRRDSTPLTDVFDFNIRIKDTRDLTRLADPQLDTLREVTLMGRVDQTKGFSELKLDAPLVRYGNLTFKHVDFKWHNLRNVADYDFLLPETEIGNGRKLSAIRLYGAAQNDAFNFSIQAQDTSFLVRGIDLNGNITAIDSLWQLQFNTSNIELFNEQWVMDDRNYLRFGTGYFDAREFELMNGDRRITLYPYNDNKGLLVTTTNLNLDYFNRFIPDTNFHMAANIYDLDCRIDNLYNLEGLHLSVNTDTVYINGRPYGILQGDIDKNTLTEPILGKIFIRRENTLLRVNGAWASETDQAYGDDAELGLVKPGTFQSTVTANRFPFYVLETFVPGIAKTAGHFRLFARMGGSPEKPNLQGEVVVEEGKFEIEYLKTEFHMRQARIELTHERIWADGDTLWDRDFQNKAVVRGGLRHNRFSDWQIAAGVESLSNRFLVMNTTKKDNDLFYGFARGLFSARFSGSFEQPDIAITAQNGPDTKLLIPLGASSEIQSASFIIFTNGEQTPTGPKRSRRNANTITGVNFDLNITVNNDAEVQLIFDEQTGDIIKGKGAGDLRLTMNRAGEFKMSGTYGIRQGEYLFTLLNLVNKPFKVAEGGTITWFGDPYGAQISLDATYTANSSLYNLLRTELELSQDQDLIQEASKPTQVIVTMHLKGDLDKPVITFDLAFPQIGSRLRSLADNKLRTLKQDPNELTRQVFGIIVIGSFLPNDNSFAQGGDYGTTAFNTVSQVLTNQLSNYLTGLASEWFSGAVSSIDLDIIYSEYRNDVLTGGEASANTGRELQVRLSSGFDNDRIVINVGSQFGTNNTPGAIIQEGFLGEDISVDIQLTENGQWRLRIYQRTEPDITGGQWRYRFGFGINFRKDYDSLAHLMDGLTGWMKKKQ
ncbi:MAG: translocation/assembly module TamB domain-containing protein [Saprospiraceae bacterium]|nr:translocation/assembly module TamB domain-containing protein [Saprospiraceae bacterium]